MCRYNVILALLVISSVGAYDYSEDIGLDIFDLATKWGYPIESHEVTTEDGYILSLHRIPHGLNNTAATKPPILLMHGLLSSSVDWVNLGPGKGFGLILADQGYDVWFGNARGTTWSRKHVELDPDQDAEKFFDFSWHEIGYYDLPAKIDHIIEMTGYDQIFYVGHSQGTTSFFVMGSTRPEYNDKIKLMQAFAPVAYMGNMPGPTLHLLMEYDYDKVLRLFEILQVHEFLPHFDFLTDLGPSFCGSGSKFQKACRDFLNLLCGKDDLINLDFIPVVTSNAPAGVSINQLKHYFQEMKSGYFRQYDYGTTKNVEKYNQDTPPVYETTKITAPVTLYYADNDYFAAVVDVQQLADELPNLVALTEVPYKTFNHLEFIWADNVAELLYPIVINELDSFSN